MKKRVSDYGHTTVNVVVCCNTPANPGCGPESVSGSKDQNEVIVPVNGLTSVWSAPVNGVFVACATDIVSENADAPTGMITSPAPPTCQPVPDADSTVLAAKPVFVKLMVSSSDSCPSRVGFPATSKVIVDVLTVSPQVWATAAEAIRNTPRIRGMGIRGLKKEFMKFYRIKKPVEKKTVRSKIKNVFKKIT